MRVRILGIPRPVLLGKNSAEVDTILIRISVGRTDKKAVVREIINCMIQQAVVKYLDDQPIFTYKNRFLFPSRNILFYQIKRSYIWSMTIINPRFPNTEIGNLPLFFYQLFQSIL